MPSKLNNNIIDNRLKNRNIKRLENYINSKIKIKFQCTKDNYIWYATPSNICRGCGCPKCGGSVKLTDVEVVERLKILNIEKLDNYINGKTKIKFKCLIDGYIWSSKPENVLNRNGGCPKCSNHIRLTNDDVDTRISHKKIKRIGNVNGTETRIEWECLIDGTMWLDTPNNIMRGGVCPKCSKSKPLTNEIVDERLKDRKIKRIGQYKNSKTKIEFKCEICEFIWTTNPVDILQGHGCPKCSKKLQLTNEDVDTRLKQKNIKRIDNYVDAFTKINFKCLKDDCNNIWSTSPSWLLNSNNGCPLCSTGKSEKKIKKMIEIYIKYDKFIHHMLIRYNNRRYHPDFYLETNNKKIIIEYNGIQHYKPIRFNGIPQKDADENFKKQQIRDEELRQYCTQNDILLIEIPYTLKEKDVINLLTNLNK